MSLLAVEHLGKAFGGVHAVRDLSFSLEAGRMLALIGPNGAGKSTCFNLLNGQLRPDSGQVLLDGRRIDGLRPRAIWRLGVGRTFQVATVFKSLTVLENIEAAAIAHEGAGFDVHRSVFKRDPRASLAALDAVGLAGRAESACATLAYGDVKRLELALALAHGPRLLLMDEPTAGMAPDERLDLMRLVRRLVLERGIGVLFTEHSMDVVFGFADDVLVMSRGELIAQGDADTVRQDPLVRAAYLGTGVHAA